MDLSSIKIDLVLDAQGGWITEIPGMQDLALKCRPLGNADYRALNEKLTEQVPRAKRPGGVLVPDEKERIRVELFVETLLLDWKNLSLGGVPIPYSKDKAREILSDPQYRDLADAVYYVAITVRGDAEVSTEEAAKN